MRKMRFVYYLPSFKQLAWAVSDNEGVPGALIVELKGTDKPRCVPSPRTRSDRRGYKTAIKSHEYAREKSNNAPKKEGASLAPDRVPHRHLSPPASSTEHRAPCSPSRHSTGVFARMF